MRLRNRFALVGAGILIFLIVTPALVLYARGFKIDWEHKTLVKTGALVVKTQPTKAEIFLNDVKQDSLTPSNLRFLTPGDFNLRIDKTGYQSWTKRLTVKSQLVTWANSNRDFITLFLQQAQEFKNFKINAVTASELGDEIIFLSADQVGSINVNNGESQTLLKTSDLQLPLLNADIEILWSDRQQALNLISNKTRLNLLQSQLTKIQRLEIENGHVVALVNSALYSVETDALAPLDENVSNFTLDRDDIWYVQKNILKHYNFTDNKFEIISDQLPVAAKSKIIRTSNQIYLILGDTLYQLNEKLEKIYSPVNHAVWDNISSQLLYSNDNEIYVYQPGLKNSDLIVRSLTAVQNPVLNTETGYVFYQNEGKIKAIELDGRDHRNIFTISDALDSFYLSQDGKKLYTISKSDIKSYTIR